MIPAVIASATAMKPIAVSVPNVTMPAGTHSASWTVAQPTNAYAEWKFDRNGRVYKNESSSGNTNWSYVHDWCDTPSSTAGDNFQVKYTAVSGTPNRGNITTGFQALSSNLYIGETVAINMDDITDQATFDITIEEIGNSGNTDTERYSAYAST